LKLYELLSGLSLDPTHPAVSGQKAVSSKIIELCKPAVDVSKTGIVDFVHFSAKEEVVSDQTIGVDSLTGRQIPPEKVE
jgi:hypothetical protein